MRLQKMLSISDFPSVCAVRRISLDGFFEDEFEAFEGGLEGGFEGLDIPSGRQPIFGQT